MDEENMKGEEIMEEENKRVCDEREEKDGNEKEIELKRKWRKLSRWNIRREHEEGRRNNGTRK